MELWLPLLVNRKNFGNLENGLPRHYSRCWWLIFEDWRQGFRAVFAQRLRKALIFRMDIATSMTSPFPCQSSMILSPSWGWADNYGSKVYPKILKSRSAWKGRVQPGWLVMDTWGTATCTWTSRLPSTARRWWMALSPSSMSGPAVTGRTSFEDFICVTCMHTFFLVSWKFQIQGQHLCRAWPWIQEEKLYPLFKIRLGSFPDEADQAGEEI